MILCAIAASLIGQGAGRSVNLSRGEIVQGYDGPYRYWEATDTYLEQANPEGGFGGQGLLIGGPKRTVLVRFGDLNRIVGPGWRVNEATLELNVNGGKPRSLTAIGAVTREWGEGPMNTLLSVLAGKGNVTRATRGQACWKFARFGDPATAWEGAAISEPIKTDIGKTNESQLVIDGLADTVQRFVDRPYENYGFALTFSEEVELISNQASDMRPRLRLKLVPTEPVRGADLSVVSISYANGEFRAVIKNVGDADAPAFRGTWKVAGEAGEAAGGSAIAKGATAEISLKKSLRAAGNDHRFQTVDFQLAPGTDGNSQNDALRYYVGGIDIRPTLPDRPGPNELGSAAPEDQVKAFVNRFNDVACGHSRYSFAPEGARERVNLVGFQNGPSKLPLREIGRLAGLRDLAISSAGHTAEDPYPGIMGGGDTRLDMTLSPRISVPNVPRFPIEESYGLLSKSDVAMLNAKLDGTKLIAPNVVLVRVLDRGTQELANLNLDFFAPSDLANPVATVRVDRSSSFILPANLRSGDYLVRATLFGLTDWIWLKEWQLTDMSARGNAAAAVLEFHFNLPTTPLDAGDLANERPVTDSANSDPDRLARLTAGGNTTEISLPEADQGWIEVDLKKDRTLGEIILEMGNQPMWKRFEIRVYGTGEKVSDAFLWTTDADFNWTSQASKRVAYRGPIVRVRYIRIINRGGGPGALTGIHVTPVKPGVGGG